MSEIIFDEFVGKCIDVRVVPSEDKIRAITKCHDNQIRADERNKVIAEIRVGLGKVQEYEYENEDTYVNFKYYKADKVLGLLSKCAETCNKQN